MASSKRFTSAYQWKAFYEEERRELGDAYLRQLIQQARSSTIHLPRPGALIFPHTYLRSSGPLIAAVALACVRAGCETVLALGVLHSARLADRDDVNAARAFQSNQPGGSQEALNKLRRVHGPGVPGDNHHWAEEFSLDSFAKLLELAAEEEKRPMPKLVHRYPFLVGNDSRSMPGFEELRMLVDQGAALVATGDLIHHGVVYRTAPEDVKAADSPETIQEARKAIEEELALLGCGNINGFLDHAKHWKSDFRDPGATLAGLLGPFEAQVLELKLTDYQQTIEADGPTWVASALAMITPI